MQFVDEIQAVRQMVHPDLAQPALPQAQLPRVREEPKQVTQKINVRYLQLRKIQSDLVNAVGLLEVAAKGQNLLVGLVLLTVGFDEFIQNFPVFIRNIVNIMLVLQHQSYHLVFYVCSATPAAHLYYNGAYLWLSN